MKIKDKIEDAIQDISNYEMDLANAELNLDAMEIEHKVAQNYTADTHIWAETAALKGVL